MLLSASPHNNDAPSCLLPVPLDTLVKSDSFTAKYIQSTPNRQVDLALAQLLHKLQILNRAAPAGIRDRDAAPLGQLGDQLVVDAALQAFDVGSVDQKLGAVGFEELDAVWHTYLY